MSKATTANTKRDELLQELRLLAQSPLAFMLYQAYNTLEQSRELLKIAYEFAKHAGTNAKEIEKLMDENAELSAKVMEQAQEAGIELKAVKIEKEEEEVEDGMLHEA